jgi:uncharacterized protein (DUF1015 family)
VTSTAHGLSLAPFRATRFADVANLGRLVSPPYDVISDADRLHLLADEHNNVVRLILPSSEEARLGDGDPYVGVGVLMQSWIDQRVLVVDSEPALFVYQLTTPDGSITRGLLGAVELRAPEDGVILPHENTMAGPVSDRLALMTSTQANLEPIYLVYDGGGAASELVASVDALPPAVTAATPDGIEHALWAITDRVVHAEVEADLRERRALIADGHHRYATYLRLQSDHAGTPGPWDRGLTFLVDTSAYGPQVHPIHRVVARPAKELVARLEAFGARTRRTSLAEAQNYLVNTDEFAVALVENNDAVIVTGIAPSDDSALSRLDVSVLHKVVVERIWGLEDTPENVGYAHSVAEAIAHADESGGTAVLLRATPVADVAAVAAAGQRMPRKSTLFTPKPASGMALRRFADQ